jgi:hypothetical protein
MIKRLSSATAPVIKSFFPGGCINFSWNTEKNVTVAHTSSSPEVFQIPHLDARQAADSLPLIISWLLLHNFAKLEDKKSERIVIDLPSSPTLDKSCHALCTVLGIKLLPAEYLSGPKGRTKMNKDGLSLKLILTDAVGRKLADKTRMLGTNGAVVLPLTPTSSSYTSQHGPGSILISVGHAIFKGTSAHGFNFGVLAQDDPQRVGYAALQVAKLVQDGKLLPSEFQSDTATDFSIQPTCRNGKIC